MPGLFWQLHEANHCIRLFGDDLARKDYGAAYSQTSSELRNQTTYPEFVKIHEALATRAGDVKSVQLQSSSIKERQSGWWATAEVQLVCSHDSLPFTFVLKRQAHVWKIYSYREE